MSLPSQLYHSLGISEIIDNTIAKIDPNIIQELNSWVTHNLAHTPQSKHNKLPPSGRISHILPIIKQLDEEIKGISESEIDGLAHELKHLHSIEQNIPRRFSTRTTLDVDEMNIPKDDTDDELSSDFALHNRIRHQNTFTPIQECNFFEKSPDDYYQRNFTPVRSTWNQSQHNGSFDRHSNNSNFSKHNFDRNHSRLTPEDLRWLESCKGNSQRIFENEVYNTPMGYNYMDSRPFTPIYHT